MSGCEHRGPQVPPKSWLTTLHVTTDRDIDFKTMFKQRTASYVHPTNARNSWAFGGLKFLRFQRYHSRRDQGHWMPSDHGKPIKTIEECFFSLAETKKNPVLFKFECMLGKSMHKRTSLPTLPIRRLPSMGPWKASSKVSCFLLDKELLYEHLIMSMATVQRLTCKVLDNKYLLTTETRSS